MSNIARMMQRATAGAGGAGLDVDEVFSTHLYKGTSTSTNIVNGIDLTEGGLVWTKPRNASSRHVWIDTARGVEKYIASSDNTAEATQSGNSLTAFNNNGYTIGNWGSMNSSSYNYVSWTFRKAPKFFDVVTYTGDGTTGRQISHSLDATVGMMILKRTDSSGYWGVYHRSGHFSAPEDYVLILGSTSARIDDQMFINDTAPTTTHFTVGAAAASGGDFNSNGATFVAYLFAHNNNDGEFGPDSDQDIIKCGKFEGLASTQNINIGFEPQWVLLKQSSAGTSSNWIIIDAMRGIVSGENDTELRANTSDAEATSSNYLELTATGFTIPSNSPFNTYGPECIYMAIRRGSLNTPEDATKVFAMDTGANSTPSFNAGFTIDSALVGRVDSTDKWFFTPRLTGSNYLDTATNAAQASSPAFGGFDYQTKYYGGNLPSSYQAWMWKRAPGYFDVCCYSGTTTAPSYPPQTLNHNLGAVVEMMWIKSRSTGGNTNYPWTVYHKDVGNTKALFLNTTDAASSASIYYWNNTTPTSTQFTVGGTFGVNESGVTYIAYLFATVPNVSCVGSVTHSGSSTDVDCGFSSGARFVLLKRTDATGDWYILDSVRGIVSGNDPYLLLNTTAAQVTNTDYIDPLSSGFQITGDFNDGDYIFYAIA